MNSLSLLIFVGVLGAIGTMGYVCEKIATDTYRPRNDDKVDTKLLKLSNILWGVDVIGILVLVHYLCL